MQDRIERNDGSNEEPQGTRGPTDDSSSDNQTGHGESLREQLQFEQVLSELSTAFVNLTSDKVDEEIQTWIQRVGELLGVDLCTVWQIGVDGAQYNVTHVCSTSGPASFPPTIPYSAFPWITEKLKRGETVVFSRVDELPHDAENEKQLFRATGLKSMVVFPLVVRGSYIGAVTFGSLSHERAWPDHLLRRLRLVGEIFANALMLRQSQKAVRDSEERFRAIYEGSPIAIEIFDREGRLLDINKAGLEMFGVSSVESVRGFQLLSDPNLSLEAREKLRRGESVRHELLFDFEKVNAHNLYSTTKSGIVHLDVEIVPLSREFGNTAVGYLIQIQDVTDRRIAEGTIKESEEKFSRVFRSSPALISISSLEENRFTEVNETFLSTLGFERDEVIGRSVLDLNLFVDPETRDEIVRVVGEQGFIRNMHIRVRTRSGDILDGLLSAESIEVRGHRYLLSVATDITEQRRMERALRKSKERFERVTQESREMVWETDSDGLFTYVNAACEEILGYRPDEMIGKMHFYDLHPEQDREEFKQESFKLIARRSIFHNSVNKVITKDGRVVWFLTSGAPLLDESGNLEGYMGADLDITERRIMEETLAAERHLFIGGPTVVFKWRAEEGWPVEYVSPNVADQFGYSREEFTSGKLLYAAIVHPEDVQRMADELEASCSAGDTYLEQEYRISRPDGESMWVRDFTVLVRDAGDKVTHYHGYVLDVTRRKRAEEALRENEQKFLKAFNSSPAIMAISTIEEGRLIEVNTAFLTILGFEREEVIGKTTLELEVFADPRHRDIIKQTVRDQKFMRNVDGTIRLRGGEIRDCLFSAEIVELSGKEYLLSVVSDVTERKRFGALLRYAVEGTSAATGRDFFCSMVTHLATALEMRYALIGEVMRPDFEILTTLAFWNSGKIGKNFQHNLTGCPCENIFDKTICLHPSDVSTLFPGDRLLAELQVESLLGMPLTNSSGQPIGILIVMNDKPFTETMIPHAKSLVSIFAARAAAELERLQVEEELRQTTERLKVEREELAEKNIALKQILGHLERERSDYKHEISAGVENLMMPYIRKLRSGAGQLKPRELDALQNAMESIVGKDIDQFLNNFAKLTPRERDICERIKSGLTSKQIASALNIDVLTVHKHRDAIRRKLQLKHKDLNLTSYLRSR